MRIGRRNDEGLSAWRPVGNGTCDPAVPSEGTLTSFGVTSPYVNKKYQSDILIIVRTGNFESCLYQPKLLIQRLLSCRTAPPSRPKHHKRTFKALPNAHEPRFLQSDISATYHQNSCSSSWNISMTPRRPVSVLPAKSSTPSTKLIIRNLCASTTILCCDTLPHDEPKSSEKCPCSSCCASGWGRAILTTTKCRCS